MKRIKYLLYAAVAACLSSPAFAEGETVIREGSSTDRLIGFVMLFILVLCGMAVGLFSGKLREWYRKRHYRRDDSEDE